MGSGNHLGVTPYSWVSSAGSEAAEALRGQIAGGQVMGLELYSLVMAKQWGDFKVGVEWTASQGMDWSQLEGG